MLIQTRSRSRLHFGKRIKYFDNYDKDKSLNLYVRVMSFNQNDIQCKKRSDVATFRTGSWDAIFTATGTNNISQFQVKVRQFINNNNQQYFYYHQQYPVSYCCLYTIQEEERHKREEIEEELVRKSEKKKKEIAWK